MSRMMSGPAFFTDPRVVEASAGYRPGDARWARATRAIRSVVRGGAVVREPD